MKLKKGVKRFLLIILILIIGGLIAAYLLLDNPKSTKKVKVLTSIPDYGYELKDNKNPEFKKLFYQLEKILKEDPVKEEEYVGGAEFVHKNALVDFLEKSQDTIYKYVESNLYEDRSQSLPTVKEVTVKRVEKSPFTYGENSDEEAYTVEVEWEYTDTSTSNGYQTEATLVFVHEDKKLSLVELQ